jgi:outer membrane protein TolC
MLLALKHNPGLKAAGMTVETAEAEVARARAKFLPRFDFGETYNFSDNPTQVFMSKLNQRVFTQEDFRLNNLNFPKPFGNFRTGLTMSQPLFQAGEAYLGYKQAKLSREMAGAIVVSARQQLLFQVTQAITAYSWKRTRRCRRPIKPPEHLKIAKPIWRPWCSDVLSARCT